MSDSRFAIIDPAAGISGDMLLGALIAAGAPRAWLTALPARLGCPDVSVDIRAVDRCGLQAVKVDVRLPGGAIEGPAEMHEHHAHDHHPHDHHHTHPHEHEHAHDEQGHAHSHGHVHGPHRHVGELIAMVERAELSPWVKDRAVRAFRLLGEAEGKVHGMPPESVALHEVGALDALVDIVGAIEGFEQLGIQTIYHRPVATGSGWVRAAHGTMSVPTPATALLLEGLEIAPNGPVTGEATTPTGAVLLRVLSAGAPPQRWRAASAGNWGAGGRNPDGYPNALRLVLAEPVREAGEVVLVSTDLDDLSPEYLDALREALFGAGALDVQVWATQAKKGRTGFRVEAVAPPGDADRVTEAFFRHSTTAGVRRETAERVTLPRRELRLDAPGGGSVRVKVLESPEGARAKPEYDDVMEAARRSGRPAHEVARELQARALTLVAAERAAKARADTTKKES
ncbi:MAG TPA: nickel pincer cofactor biosynthesis protein LarC [Gemmatimonadales bacterium]|nr:nickel pincer cofactor biosynthesis protein LarC [Gemmatimonadales bacterium]